MTNKHTRWAAALVPYDEITCQVTNWRHTVFMDANTSKGERKRFYESLLEIKWLSPKVRYAVMGELGLSLRKQKRDYQEGRTAALRHMVNEAKARMRNNGERPPEGIHNAAVLEVAGRQGMTVPGLKKLFQRYKKTAF